MPDAARTPFPVVNFRGYEREAVDARISGRRNRAVAPVAPEAHLLYALTRIAPPVARWFAARTSAVLAK